MSILESNQDSHTNIHFSVTPKPNQKLPKPSDQEQQKEGQLEEQKQEQENQLEEQKQEEENQLDQESQLEESHYIPLINSTVNIRQLRSLGLSFQLWPAATSLVNLLSLSTTSLFSLPSRRPRILELGSGTGLVGISFAAALGAHVTLTDLPHVLPNLKFNVDANAALVEARGGEVHVAALRWGEEEDMAAVGREFDLVLGSDVVYYDHLYDPLLRTLKHLMVGERGIVFVMGHLRRWKKDSAFFKKAKKAFDVRVIHTDEPCDGRRVGVVVYRFEPKTCRVS